MRSSASGATCLGKVHFETLDLADLRSVWAFAERVNREGETGSPRKQCWGMVVPSGSLQPMASSCSSAPTEGNCEKEMARAMRYGGMWDGFVLSCDNFGRIGSSGRRYVDDQSRLVRFSWHAPIDPHQVGPTTARWGKEISSVFHEGFRVGRLFRATVHGRHVPDVFVHGTADQPGCV
jgi:hypothetical protein